MTSKEAKTKIMQDIQNTADVSQLTILWTQSLADVLKEEAQVWIKDRTWENAAKAAVELAQRNFLAKPTNFNLKFLVGAAESYQGAWQPR